MKGKNKLEEVRNKHIEVGVRKDYKKLVQQEQAEVEKRIGLGDVFRKEERGDEYYEELEEVEDVVEGLENWAEKTKHVQKCPKGGYMQY